MSERFTKPRYLLLAGAAMLLATIVMLVFRDALQNIDAGAGGFGWDRVNILALAGLLFMDTLFMAFLAYNFLFPRFKQYQQECMEGEGQLLKNLTDELRAPLYAAPTFAPSTERLNLLTERRKVAQFQFIIRCARLSFCLAVLFGLLSLASHVLTVAMLAAPNVPLSSLPL